MTDIHITRELLEAVSRGELPERFLVQTGMQHLASLCPFCREEILAWEAKRAARPEYGHFRTGVSRAASPPGPSPQPSPSPLPAAGRGSAC